MNNLHHIAVWFFDIEGYIMYAFGFGLATIVGLFCTSSKKKFLTLSVMTSIVPVLILNYFYKHL